MSPPPQGVGEVVLSLATSGEDVSSTSTIPVEVLPGRLYWRDLELDSGKMVLPKESESEYFFCIDNELVYEAFSRDFGPLHLGMVYKYSVILHRRLKEAAMTNRRVTHCCSTEPQKRSNAVFLICAYQVIAFRVSAEAAFAPFKLVEPPFLPFRDASGTKESMFDLSILDCLQGLEFAIKMDWFNWTRFNVAAYEHYSRVDKGDMNWIIPNKFLAFCGPSPTPIDSDGYPAWTPEDYSNVFRKIDVTLVVRLNKKQYDRNRFMEQRIKHVDLYFKDGSCPPQDIISRFLYIAERELMAERERPPAVAVHCKAGLGRTGTLIGLYAMKHYSMPPRAFIGWSRLCRPGSILGPQQQFLVNMQTCMFQAGYASRSPQVLPLKEFESNHKQTSQFDHQAESYEDVGQGERLCGARRMSRTYWNGEENDKAYLSMTTPKGAMNRPLVTVGKCLFSTEPNCLPKQVCGAY